MAELSFCKWLEYFQNLNYLNLCFKYWNLKLSLVALLHWRQRQEGYKFKARLGNLPRVCRDEIEWQDLVNMGKDKTKWSTWLPYK